MDDAGRSDRFSPYYTNTGFYYIRANRRTKHFLRSTLWMWEMVVQWSSHQSVFIQTLDDHVRSFGFRYKLLSQEEFPGGQTFHHKKTQMRAISEGKYVPYMFHMCWTQFKKDKLQFLQESNLWYVSELGCPIEELNSKTGPDGLIYDGCCKNFNSTYLP